MPPVFCIVDDKSIPLYRIMWISNLPHFCGQVRVQGRHRGGQAAAQEEPAEPDRQKRHRRTQQHLVGRSAGRQAAIPEHHAARHSQGGDGPVVGGPDDDAPEEGAHHGRAISRGKDALVEGGLDQHGERGECVGQGVQRRCRAEHLEVAGPERRLDPIEAAGRLECEGDGYGERDAHDQELRRIRERVGPEATEQCVEQGDAAAGERTQPQRDVEEHLSKGFPCCFALSDMVDNCFLEKTSLSLISVEVTQSAWCNSSVNLRTMS